MGDRSTGLTIYAERESKDIKIKKFDYLTLLLMTKT